MIEGHPAIHWQGRAASILKIHIKIRNILRSKWKKGRRIMQSVLRILVLIFEKEFGMINKFLVSVAAAGALMMATAPVRAQVAGSSVIEVAVEETAVIAEGWSAKKQLLGKAVYNEENKKVGKISDLIISPEKTVSYAIVSAGGFVGLGEHDVLIPVAQFKKGADNKILLAGATKEKIKALPKFHYTKK